MVVAVAVLASGCGGSGNDSQPTPQAVGFTAFCEGALTASMGKVASCLHANPALLPGVADGCAEIQKEITANRVAYDATRGAACLAASQAATCADLLSGGWASLSGCEQVLTGRVANGGGCYSSGTCASGFCTADWTSACPGTCQAFAGSGASCAAAECAPGLVCEWSAAGTATCKAASAAGGACPCQDGLWCDAGVCRARQTSGACSLGGAFQCALGYACSYSAASPTCLPVVGAGGSCTAASEVCGPGYACVAGTCTSWPSVGQACGAPAYACIGGYCASGTCLAHKAPGAACGADHECASGLCSAGGACEAAAACSAP